MLCLYTIFRYAKELSHTRWSAVRKGAVFGLYNGWLHFVGYIIYATGFIFGSTLMSYDDQSNISDILVVCNSSEKLMKEKMILFIQVTSIFELCTEYLASIGVFHQSLLGAQAAAASVFQTIDQVKLNHLKIKNES